MRVSQGTWEITDQGTRFVQSIGSNLRGFGSIEMDEVCD